MVQESVEKLIKPSDLNKMLGEYKEEIGEVEGLILRDDGIDLVEGEIPEDFDGVPFGFAANFEGQGKHGSYSLKVLENFYSSRKVELSVERETGGRGPE